MVKKYMVFVCLLLFIRLSYGQTVDSCDAVIFIEEAPVFKGDLEEFIHNKINYPVNAKKDSIEGTVIISFIIDTLGFTFNHKIVKGIQRDINEEALRVAKLIKFERPALQKGKPIEVKCTIPVKFYIGSIEKERKYKKK